MNQLRRNIYVVMCMHFYNASIILTLFLNLSYIFDFLYFHMFFTVFYFRVSLMLARKVFIKFFMLKQYMCL